MNRGSMSTINSRRFFVIVLAATLTSAWAAAGDFSGKWSGSAPDGPGGMYVVLHQEGTKLTGSAGPTQARQFPMVNGTVEGDHLVFEIKMGGGTIHFDLVSAGAELTGTVRMSGDDGHTDSTKIVLKRTA
jgi:hypothetical protein